MILMSISENGLHFIMTVSRMSRRQTSITLQVRTINTPLDNSPITKTAVSARRKQDCATNSATSTSPAPRKQRRLDMTSFLKIIIENGIKTDLELCALLKRQHD